MRTYRCDRRHDGWVPTRDGVVRLLERIAELLEPERLSLTVGLDGGMVQADSIEEARAELDAELLGRASDIAVLAAGLRDGMERASFLATPNASAYGTWTARLAIDGVRQELEAEVACRMLWEAVLAGVPATAEGVVAPVPVVASTRPASADEPPAPTFTLRRDWVRWKGTYENLVALARAAAATVDDGGGGGMTVAVNLTEKRGLHYEGTGDEALDTLGRRDPEDFERLDVAVKTSRYGPPHVELRVSRSGLSPALTLTTRGSDEVAVRRSHTFLSAEIERGRRRPAWWDSGYAIAVACVLALVAALAALAHRDSDNTIVLLAVDGPAALLAGTAWLMPSLELLRPGEKTRVQRARGVVVAGVGAWVIGIASSIVVS